MISLQTLAALPPPAWRTPLKDPRKPAAEDRSPGVGLPSLMEMRDGHKAMKKEMAARKVQAVRERRDALMLMVKIDPKAALKMTVALAKELKDAVKDFVDAGGKNPTVGEMALMRRDAKDARGAADAAAASLPVEPKDVVSSDVQSEAETAKADAEVKRAHEAYGAAFGIADAKDEKADGADAVLGAAMSDAGFFEQVKIAVGELKAAREKIKADWANLKAPNKDEWKVADTAMGELEQEIDLAPTGAAEVSDAPRAVTA